MFLLLFFHVIYKNTLPDPLPGQGHAHTLSGQREDDSAMGRREEGMVDHGEGEGEGRGRLLLYELPGKINNLI